MAGEIRRSPYEEGLFFVPAEPGTTLQDHSTQWQVGKRYSLLKVLGYGSYSAVVLAVDNETGEKVALKRVADVLQSPDHCKRVLREICILRRLRHPNLIGIRDAFVRPSATGQCRLIGGKLVNLSVDVYIAMELADGGDLFHLRGQVSADEVKSLMWQLLVTIKYLHSVHVWHRDMKSQNVFLVWEHGERVIKIGDFGSARSATPHGYQTAEQSAPNRADTVEIQKEGRDGLLHPADSYQQMNEAMEPGDLYAQPTAATHNGSRPSGFKAPLTRVVATPCYRAPEVVMSRGGYTAAIDMWSLGCIFGELLQRIAHVGSAAAPNLQVAPLFAIHGLPKTPEDGESFLGGPGNEMTRSELQALFAVIGTPCWADVAAVQEPQWRRYLHHLPGRAPTLYRRFAAAGEAAVDLVSRLLAFDPTRRCSPEEALAHEYFSDIAISEGGSFDDLVESPMARSRRSGALLGRYSSQDLGTAPGGGAALATPICHLQPYTTLAAGAAEDPAQQAAAPNSQANSLAAPFTQQLHMRSSGSDSGTSGGGGGAGEARPSPFAAPSAAGGGDADMADAAAAGAAGPAAGQPPAGRQQGEKRRHYWEESDPGKALSMLEDELLTITDCWSTASPAAEGCQKLRQMLEAECRAVSDSLGAAGSGGGGGGEAGAAAAGAASPDPGGSGKKRARVPPGMDSSILAGLLSHRAEGLQVDTAAAGGRDADQYARERLSNVADTQAGRELDPSRILGPQRHGEWFKQQPQQGPAAGPRWGVTALPPGTDEARIDPQMLAIMRAQQGR